LTYPSRRTHNPTRAPPPEEHGLFGGCVFLGTNRSAVHQAVADIRAKAKELRESFGAEGRARALEWAATKVEAALISEADRIVYLPEAARISGFCEGHLGRLVRRGQIPDMRPPGSRGRIKVRVADLPTKAGQRHTPHADVRDLASRLGIRGKEA
jgi:hypothetical protein